jgi:hypothetical protein
MDSHDSSAGEVKNTTDQRSADEKRSATQTINVGKDKTGGDEEDDILNNGRRKSGVASHSSHVEDINEIVQHDVSTPEHTLASVTYQDFE